METGIVDVREALVIISVAYVAITAVLVVAIKHI
jgi:hypothetical protein